MNIRRIILLGALVGALGASASRLHGAEFIPPTDPPRFLFIVEKSDATRALGLDLSQTMFDLVYRGANGHLPDGGVFEIWIFGEETVFRGFAPQMLTPNNRLPVASRASAYVRATKSGGPADVARLLEHVRGASELGMELTIILVTAPDTRVSGTPRDAEINGMFDLQAEAQRAAGRPFITSLRVQDAVLAASTVSDSPFTMTMPPMPPSKLTPEEREQRVADARQARLEREKAAAPPEPVVVIPAPPPRRPDIPDEEREGAIILKGSPRTAEPPAETATKPTTEPTPSPAPVPADPAPPANANGVTAPTPVEAAIAPAATLAATNSAPTPSTAMATPTPPASATNAVPQPAVAVPARTWLTAGGLFVAGLGFFVVAALLAWVLMRRARAAAGPSYITRSIENRRDS